MTDQFSVRIQSLVQEGYGLTRLPDGRALFVPFTMPGEEVEVRIIQEKSRHAFAQVERIITAHAARVRPRCQHYSHCGGCRFQHIPYELQLQYKQHIFLETLERIGGIRHDGKVDMVASPQVWNYRNSIQFHLSSQGDLAFADWMDSQIFPVKECHLPMPLVDRIWQQMDFKTRLFERVELRQNLSDDVMIIFHGSADSLPELESQMTASIVHLDGQDQVILAGEGQLRMPILGEDFQVSAGSFFRANFPLAESLASEVKQLVHRFGGGNIMDLYSGVGFFSAFLASQARCITAVESNPAACEDFAVNLDAYDHISLYQGRVEQVLPLLDLTPDCVILDPPRAGLHKEAARALLRLSPPLVIYVSCNPATLARDARQLLQNGYRLESVTLLDMFPQTCHTESINLFLRTGDN